jgi:hypothetical protein
MSVVVTKPSMIYNLVDGEYSFKLGVVESSRVRIIASCCRTRFVPSDCPDAPCLDVQIRLD